MDNVEQPKQDKPVKTGKEKSTKKGIAIGHIGGPNGPKVVIGGKPMSMADIVAMLKNFKVKAGKKKAKKIKEMQPKDNTAIVPGENGKAAVVNTETGKVEGAQG